MQSMHNDPRRRVAEIQRRREQLRKKRRRKRIRAVLLLLFAIAAAVGLIFVIRACVDDQQGAQILPEETGVLSQTGTSGSEAQTAEPLPQAKRLHVLSAGDNIMHDAVLADAKHRGTDGAYAFAAMYAGIASLIETADISFINQEGPVGADGAYIGYPDFNAPPAVFETLQDLGFDVVNLANNHMLDKGEQGLGKVIAAAQTYDFLSIGGYTQSDYDTPRILEKDGVKIAFLSYTTLINYAHKYELSAASPYVIPYAEETVIRRQVAAAKQAADFVLVSMHWGDEAGWDQKTGFTQNEQQARLAQLFADLGVDVVIGHHPHVVQPITWLEGADGGRTLVYYSLGNLLCTMHYAQYLVGALGTFDLVLEPDGSKRVENAACVPTVCHYSLTRDGLQVYRLEDYSEELAAQHGSTLKNAFSYALLQQFIRETVDASYLPAFLQ